MIYDWPLDWFGNHRAYRVDRALKVLRHQLTELVAAALPNQIAKVWYPLIFEAAVLQPDNGKKEIPPHNLTLFLPYQSSPCNDLLPKVKADFLQVLGKDRGELERVFDSKWFSNAKADFEALEEGVADANLPRRCFDHLVGLTSRSEVHGYTHQVLCEHYFSKPAEDRPLWYHAHVAEPSKGELYGKITARPKDEKEAPENLNNRKQEPCGPCKASDSHKRLMKPFLPVVSRHKLDPEWGNLDLIAIPVHSIHRWETPTYGTFLGWLYLFQKPEHPPDSEQELKMLQFLWPLLDLFAMEIIEGEIQDYLGHYKGANKPREELIAAIPRLSGWQFAEDQTGTPDDGHLATFRNDKLFVRVDAGENIVLQPRWTTSVPPESDKAREFGTQRFAHRVRYLYRTLSTVFEQAESSRLRKYEQMLQLLQRPLAELSSSIGNMQRHTQELRAVLYEPEEALFASYSIIEPLFRENHEIKFKKANLLPITVRHLPAQYSLVDIPLVAAKVACAIFGIGSRLEEAEDRNRVLSAAVGELSEIMAEDAYKELAKDFKWLTNVSASTDTSCELIKILDCCATSTCTEGQKDILAKALTRIKACLFTPFKVDSREWPQATLQLLVRHQAFGGATLTIFGKTIHREAAPVTDKLFGANGDCFPGSFANLLAFIRDFSSAATSAGKNQAKEVAYSFNDTSCEFALSFSRRVVLNIENAKRQAIASMGVLKDWRLEGANYGDLTGAIVRFANRLPGIAEDWELQTADTPANTFICLLNKSTKFRFAVSLEAGHLTITTKSIL